MFTVYFFLFFFCLRKYGWIPNQQKYSISFPSEIWPVPNDEEKKQAEEEASKYYSYTEAQNIFVTLLMKAKYTDQCGNF